MLENTQKPLSAGNSLQGESRDFCEVGSLQMSTGQHYSQEEYERTSYVGEEKVGNRQGIVAGWRPEMTPKVTSCDLPAPRTHTFSPLSALSLPPLPPHSPSPPLPLSALSP